MLPAIQSKAMRIARGDNDIAQDIQAMAYSTYQRALDRGKDLSVGELVNVMKYRASDIRKGARPHFGNISTKTTNDVFNVRNYYNGDVEIVSLDLQQNESDDNDKGHYTALTASRNLSDNVLFDIGFDWFMKKLDPVNRKILQLRLENYKYSEIAAMIGLGIYSVRRRLQMIGMKFIEYFDLPHSYIETYGLA